MVRRSAVTSKGQTPREIVTTGVRQNTPKRDSKLLQSLISRERMIHASQAHTNHKKRD